VSLRCYSNKRNNGSVSRNERTLIIAPPEETRLDALKPSILTIWARTETHLQPTRGGNSMGPGDMIESVAEKTGGKARKRPA
jgi:hypothetical protein